MAAILFSIGLPAQLCNRLERLLVTALSISHSCGEFAIPELQVVLYGCRHRSLFIVRLNDDLNLNAEIIERHIGQDET